MKFSVVIPVYNKADTIVASIDSVLAQTVSDIQIIIVDDGSTDNLSDVLAAYGDRLTVIHQKNGGVSVARNTGIANAVGDYICFLDGDDLWKPDHLKTLSDLIEKYPACEYFLTSHVIETGTDKPSYSGDHLQAYAEDFECDDLIGLLNATSYSVIHTNSICVKNKVFARDHIAFEPGIRIGEDTDVWYRLALRNRVAVSKHNTTVYRREYSTATKNTSHTHDWIFSLRENDILSDAAISQQVKHSVAQLLDRYHLTSSRECMVQGNRKEAKKQLQKVRRKQGKRYWLTTLFCLLPYAVCRRLLHRA